jgi:hypothetical protein
MRICFSLNFAITLPREASLESEAFLIWDLGIRGCCQKHFPLTERRSREEFIWFD